MSPSLLEPKTADKLAIHPLILKAISQAISECRARDDGRIKVGAEKLAAYVPNALQYLIECAVDKKQVLTTYENVSDRLGIGNPRLANSPFASIGRLLSLLQGESKFSGENFPDITSLVAHKGRKMAGVGAFLPDPSVMSTSLSAQIDWLEERRQQVYRFPRWREVLSYLDIAPLRDLSTTQNELDAYDARSSEFSIEGEEHRSIKHWIKENASRIVNGLTEVVETKTEFLFWSKDRVDVWVKTMDEWIGFEVKPSTASVDELRRGIYQVVKYRALMRAELLARGSKESERCFLALGGSLPNELRDLANRLSVAVVENIAAIVKAS